MTGRLSIDQRHPNVQRHAVADSKPTGHRRASVDSMVYSSDQGGSPNTSAAVAAGEEGTGRTSTAVAAAAAGGPAAASKIPVSVLAWLNDDDLGGSSDDDGLLPSSHGGEFASAAAPPVRHSSRSALGRLVPAKKFGSSSDRQGAVAVAAAAAAAAAKMAVGTGGHTDPRGQEFDGGQATHPLGHDPEEGNEECPPSPARRPGLGNNSPAEAPASAAAQGASAAQHNLPTESTAALPSGPGTASRTPFPQKGLRGLAVHGHKPRAVGKGEAGSEGSSGSRSWDGGERDMRSWLSRASDDDDDEEEEGEEESRGGRAQRSPLQLAGEREMQSWLSEASDDDEDEEEGGGEEGSRGTQAKSGKGDGKRRPLSKQVEVGSTTTR